MTWENMTTAPDDDSAAYSLMDGARELGHVFYADPAGDWWEAWDETKKENLGRCFPTRKGAMIALRRKVAGDEALKLAGGGK